MQEGLRSDEGRFAEIEGLGRVDLKTELELFDIVHALGGEGHGDLLAGAGGGKFAFFDANALHVAAVEIGGELCVLPRTRIDVQWTTNVCSLLKINDDGRAPKTGTNKW